MSDEWLTNQFLLCYFVYKTWLISQKVLPSTLFWAELEQNKYLHSVRWLEILHYRKGVLALWSYNPAPISAQKFKKTNILTHQLIAHLEKVPRFGTTISQAKQLCFQDYEKAYICMEKQYRL